MAITQTDLPTLEVPFPDEEMDRLSDTDYLDMDMTFSNKQDEDLVLDDNPINDEFGLQQQDPEDDLIDDFEENDDLIDDEFQYDGHDNTVDFDVDDTTRTGFGDETFITAHEEPAEVHISPAHNNNATGDFSGHSSDHTFVNTEHAQAFEVDFEGNKNSKTHPALPPQSTKLQDNPSPVGDLLEQSQGHEGEPAEEATAGDSADVKQAAPDAVTPAIALSPGSPTAQDPQDPQEPQEPQVTFLQSEATNAEMAESELDNLTTADDLVEMFSANGANEDTTQEQATNGIYEGSETPTVPTVVLHFPDDYKCSLFPPFSPNTSVSKLSHLETALPNRAARQSLQSLFDELRKRFREYIPDDELMKLSIPLLGLDIFEESSDCLGCTFEELASIYLTLKANDGIHDPQPLHVYLETYTRLASRIAVLFQAVNEQKGYSLVDFLEDTNSDASRYEDRSEEEGFSGEHSSGQSTQADGSHSLHAESHYEEDVEGSEEPHENSAEDPELHQEHGTQGKAVEYQLDEPGELHPAAAEHHSLDVDDGYQGDDFFDPEYQLIDYGDEAQLGENQVISKDHRQEDFVEDEYDLDVLEPQATDETDPPIPANSEVGTESELGIAAIEVQEQPYHFDASPWDIFKKKRSASTQSAQSNPAYGTLNTAGKRSFDATAELNASDEDSKRLRHDNHD